METQFVMPIKLIALSSYSKAGKDTFYQTLARLCPGAIRISVGDIIRDDCYDLIKERLGIYTFDCSPEQKEIIRPILVGYGISQRKKTKGKYFTDILQSIIEEHYRLCPLSNQYFVMTDLRFDEYEKDEVNWVKDQGGVVVHISRYENVKKMERTYDFDQSYQQMIKDSIVERKQYIQPPNATEAENDPKIRVKADYLVDWESKNEQSHFEYHVNQFLDWIKNNWSVNKNLLVKV